MQKKIIVVCILVINLCALKAQDFKYKIQKSTNQYKSTHSQKNVNGITDTTTVDISEPVIVPPFDYVFKLPIGFPFICAGKIIDTLQIRTTGLITFDNESKYNFIFFNKEFLFDTDSKTLSSISYKTERLNDASVLKIEFKNMLLLRQEGKVHLNFQVWLYQANNSIEFHMGGIQGVLANESCIMGLINMNNTSEAAVGYLLQGNAASPSGTLIPANGSLVELNTLPVAGTVYKFISN